RARRNRRRNHSGCGSPRPRRQPLRREPDRWEPLCPPVEGEIRTDRGPCIPPRLTGAAMHPAREGRSSRLPSIQSGGDRAARYRLFRPLAIEEMEEEPTSPGIGLAGDLAFI